VDAQKCNHENLVGFVKEDNHLYCEEGQKFHGATCSNCSCQFIAKNKPSKNKPIYYCPRFEEEVPDGVECTCVLCYACYTKETLAAPRTKRGNRGK
jgi:hypothetical protein